MKVKKSIKKKTPSFPFQLATLPASRTGFCFRACCPSHHLSLLGRLFTDSFHSLSKRISSSALFVLFGSPSGTAASSRRPRRRRRLGAPRCTKPRLRVSRSVCVCRPIACRCTCASLTRGRVCACVCAFLCAIVQECVFSSRAFTPDGAAFEGGSASVAPLLDKSHVLWPQA